MSGLCGFLHITGVWLKYLLLLLIHGTRESFCSQESDKFFRVVRIKYIVLLALEGKCVVDTDSSNTGLYIRRYIGPVSYTHLDVYKRQLNCSV